MTRPFWYIGIALLIGCLIGAWLPTNALVMTAIGILIVLMMAVPLFRRRRVLLLSLIGFCAAFVSLAVVQLCAYLPLSRRVGQTVALTAQVKEQHDAICLTVIDGELPKGTCLRFWNYDDSRLPKPYDCVKGKFVLCEYEEQGLSLMQRKADGVWFAVTAEEMVVISSDVPWYACFATWRERAVDNINGYLSGDVAALVSGICFGADTLLSEQAKSNFRVSGIYHLFSVSGFHMAFLSQLLLGLLTRLRLPRFWRSFIVVLVVVFFMLLVGTEAPVIRSGILCILVLLGSCFRRQADTCNSLGFALIVLLLGSPFAAYDVGLLLSFFATFGLVLISPRLTRVACGWLGENTRQRFPFLAKQYDNLVGVISLTLSASVATIPISLVYFGEISLAAVIGNLLTALPSSLLLIVGFAATLCIGAWLQPLTVVFFFVAGQFSRYLLWISEKISKIPFVTVAITAPYLLLWVVGVSILALIGYRLLRCKGLSVVAVTGVLTLILSIAAYTVLMRGVATVTVLPTQGEIAFCVQYEGRTVLICAPQKTGTVHRMKTALRLSGVRQVDALIVPFGSETALTVMLTQWDDMFDEAQIWCTDETAWMSAYAQTTALFPQTPVSVIDGVQWCAYGQQLHFSVQQTDILCCLTDEEVRSLPLALRQCEVVIFGKDVPQDALLLQTTVGFLPTASNMSVSPSLYGTKRLLTVGQERIRIATRGMGDIAYSHRMGR